MITTITTLITLILFYLGYSKTVKGQRIINSNQKIILRNQYKILERLPLPPKEDISEKVKDNLLFNEVEN